MTIRKIQIAAPAKKPAAKKAAPKSKKDGKPKLGKGAAEPTAYFASLEANRKGSMKVMKKQWAKAVKKAEAEGKGKKGPYIMRIFKNLMGISTASLPGLGNEPSVLDQVPPPGGPEPLVPLRHMFEAAGLTKKAPAKPEPFDYKTWKNSGKAARKTGLTDNDGNLIPRKVHPDLKG